MTLDAHQHFWAYDPAQYPWIPPGSALQRDWLPEHLAPLQQATGIEGTIAVQARQSLAETRWLLALAACDPRIRGVVGWVDLCSPGVADELAEFAGNPRFVGVRHVVQDEPDDAFMLRPDFGRGISALAAVGLPYDLLIYPRQLSAALELVRRFPEQPFVVDHLAKPSIRTGEVAAWRQQMAELAQAPNVWCKVSGMVTEADHRRWQPADFRPYLDAVFEMFGAERLMFGSDWPVCLLAASYGQVHDLVADYAQPLSEAQRTALFGGNAARFYKLA